MVLASPSLLDLLPADLALELRALARAGGVAEDDAVTCALRDYVALLKTAPRPSEAETVEREIGRLARQAVDVAAGRMRRETVGPVPRLPQRWITPTRPRSWEALVVDVVATAVGPMSIADMMAAIERQHGRTLTYTVAAHVLRWAAMRSRIRRTGWGRYEALARVEESGS